MAAVNVVRQKHCLNILREKRHTLAVQFLSSVIADVLSEDLDLAGVGLHKSRRGAYRSRLARSVTAEHTEDLTFPNLKTQGLKDITPCSLVLEIYLPKLQGEIISLFFRSSFFQGIIPLNVFCTEILLFRCGGYPHLIPHQTLQQSTRSLFTFR